MKKILLPILSLALALLVPSCLEHETEITLNKDGSGTITEESIFSAQMVGMLEMAAAQGGAANNPLAEMRDEAKAKEKAKAFGEGVTFVKTEDIKNDKGGKGVRVTYKFTDINKVSFNPSGSMSSLAPQAPGVEIEKDDSQVTFNYEDEVLTLNFPQPDEDEAIPDVAGAGDDIPAAMEAQMKEMLKGMKMSAKVTVADGIAETDATYHEGKTITLLEMDMDEIFKNPGGFAALSKLEDKDPDKAAAALKNIKGAKAETQKKVTVKVQ